LAALLVLDWQSVASDHGDRKSCRVICEGGGQANVTIIERLS
jgi:hypothetical protein